MLRSFELPNQEIHVEKKQLKEKLLSDIELFYLSSLHHACLCNRVFSYVIEQTKKHSKKTPEND